MQKILIVKTSSLGDIIHAYPVLEYLRTKVPSVKIDWVVEKQNAELVQAHPEVDQTLCIATKEWRRGYFKQDNLKSMNAFRRKLRENEYDVVFDLQGNIKSGLVVSQARSSCKVGFARQSVPEWPNLLFTNRRFNPHSGSNIREDYLSIVKSFFGDSSPQVFRETILKITDSQRGIIEALLQSPALQCGPKVIVCPGSAWKNKQATPESLKDFLLQVKKFLSCSFLLLWGSSEERLLADQLHGQFAECSLVVDRMSLPMLQNLMSACDLVIAMDSLPLHLAGTTSTPTFSVFGPSSASKYKPPGKVHYAFQGVCPYGKAFEKRCPILRTCPTGACIRSIGGDELFASFTDWWVRDHERL